MDKIRQQISTTGAVIDACGGNTPFLALINRGQPADRKRDKQHVSNYRSTGRFPADTFLIVTEHLRLAGLEAKAALWGIREPVVQVKAKARAA